MPQREQRTVVIRANQRKTRVVSGNPMSYQELSPEGAESMVMFRVSAAPGQSTGPDSLRHGGDETLLVLSGNFEIEVEGLRHSLAPGDSVFIPRGQRHLLTNVGAETAEAVFVISPPKY